jgi:hypothetical protein
VQLTTARPKNPEKAKKKKEARRKAQAEKRGLKTKGKIGKRAGQVKNKEKYNNKKLARQAAAAAGGGGGAVGQR